jgi:hypothetical protein
MENIAIWNLLLSVLLAVVGFFMVAKFKELDRLSVLLNRTREEVARDHITRAEFRQDMNELLKRLDALSLKLDTLRERRIPQD